MKSVPSLPTELYRPIVELVDARDLFKLCLVCRVMRDEAEGLIYSTVELTARRRSLAIQLKENIRQRRHIQHFSIVSAPYRSEADILTSLMSSLPNGLVALSLFDTYLGSECYIALSKCQFSQLKEFTCSPHEYYGTLELNRHRITFLENHPMIEKLFWQGEERELEISHRGSKLFAPETLPRLQFLEAAAELVFPLLGPRPITHLRVRNSSGLPASRSLAPMARLIAFECHVWNWEDSLADILDVAPHLKFYGTVLINEFDSVSLTQPWILRNIPNHFIGPSPSTSSLKARQSHNSEDCKLLQCEGT